MAWLGLDAPNIAQGWGGPPQLHAPEIGGLVAGILHNRLAQQEFQQKNIADAIKQMQDQRQSQAYTDALQKAGLLPEGDYSGLGIKGGESLADMIQRQKAEQALEAHRSAALGVARSRGGSGGSPDAPELYTDPNTGQVWRRGPSGRWIPMKSPSSQTPAAPKLSPTEKGWAAPEIPGLSVNVNAPEDTIPLQPDVPPMPDAAPTPAPADQAGGHAPDYGTDATAMSADDVRAAYKAGKMTIEEAKTRLKAMGFSD